MKKNRKWIRLSLMFLVLVGVLLLAGCGMLKKRSQDGDMKLYYLNMDVTSLVSQPYDMKASELDRADATKELLEMLGEEPESSNIRRTLATDIVPKSVVIDKETITVDFPESFPDLPRTDQVLIRAAIVKTLTQIPGNEYVRFTVNGQEMTRRDGSAFGSYVSDDFLENQEAAINTQITEDIILYFTDREGTCLYPVKRRVTFISSTPLEKVILQQLILGTTTKELKSTIPSGTGLISVTLVNGVCYVNLDDTFLNDQSNDISEQVVLYSIVNSLTELEGIDRVQISVNGDSSQKLRYNFELNTFYSYNEDIVSYYEEMTETVTE